MKEVSLDNKEKLILIGKALSVEDRVEILKLLNKEELSINDIANRLNIPPSTCALHVKILEEANLIHTLTLKGVRGTKKICSIEREDISISLQSKDCTSEYAVSMPIGNYVDYKVEENCGIVSEKGPIDEEDEPRCFYNPDRTKAQLLWFGKGYVEYRFPNNSLKEKSASELELSMEICSEDHEYNLDYPSDITLWMNGIEVATYTSPSDFGGRRGKLNPTWWPDKNTQYGELVVFRVTKEGTYIGTTKITDNSIEQYDLSAKDYISVKIGIKEDAKHIGGINLFGEAFGDYNQNIVMKIKLG